MKENNKGFAHIIAASRYSLGGIKYMLAETAFRQELIIGVVHFLTWLTVFFLAPSLFSNMCFAATTVMWVLVLIAEMFNSAIEAVVDIVSPGINDLAKKAKDIASAGVMLSLALFMGAWGCVLLLWTFG